MLGFTNGVRDSQMLEGLKPGEVDVWYVWPERITDERLHRHTQILSNDERIRAESFRFESDRNLHLLSKAFVRILLSRYTSIDPSVWEFTRNEYGKPAISQPASATHIRFNISHTRGLIAGVFALNSTVGIDAENHHQQVDVLSIAHNYLSTTEYSVLCDVATSDRHRRFLEYWTLKEAYAKAEGMGMSMDLSRFTFEIHNEKASISFHSKPAEDSAFWKFQLLRPGPDHTAAVAVCCPLRCDVQLNINDGTFLMQ